MAVEQDKYGTHLRQTHRIVNLRNPLPGNFFLVQNFALFLRNTKAWWEQNIQLNAIKYQNGFKGSFKWKNIKFLDGRISFHDSKGTYFKPLHLTASITYLNNLKESYFNTIYPNEKFRLLFYKSELQISLSPDASKLLHIVEQGKNYYNSNVLNGIFVEPRIKENRNTENERVISAFLNRKPVLQHLSKIQMREYKLITVKEMIGEKEEDAIIFHVKTRSEKILLIWENINPNRACHIFLANNPLEESQLRPKLTTFITEKNRSIKRDLLRTYSKSAIEVKKRLNFHKSIRHEPGMEDKFINILKKCIRDT